ncbi:MAG: glycosyltransferase family 2 protein [Leptolyngbyaceae cyanobacterium SM2_5_2]|nr:glycosyltransferase family 2 protein [Leptolyngbyaceae cyanobacterium SM2_5_2]
MLLNLPKIEKTHSIFIIIPVHNRCATTLRCLAQLEAQGDLETFQVVIVDDGSTDGTTAAIQACYPSVTILQGNGQLWWTGAIAMGMRYAYQHSATHMIWLNDDCLVPEETFSNLVSFIVQNPRSIIGSQGYSDNAYTHLVFGGKHLNKGYYELFECPRETIVPCDMLSGNLVCIPRSVVDEIGFPGAILPHYGGDTLYLIRARKTGFNLFVDARTTCLDIPGNSSLQPISWMLQDGEPTKTVKLIFQPQSILSWRVWWVLLTADHGFIGVIYFFEKYLWILPKLVIITGLRLLPVGIRRRMMRIKQQIIA